MQGRGRALDAQHARVHLGAVKRVSLQHSLPAMSTVPSSSALPSGTSTVWKTSITRNAQLQHAAKPAPAVDLPALHGAGRVIHEQLVKDAQAVPALGDMLTIRAYIALLWLDISLRLYQLARHRLRRTVSSQMTTASHFKSGGS